MGLFDKWKSNKDELNQKETELAMSEEQFKEHHAYLMEFKKLLEGLSDSDKKYAHLCPPLGASRNEDGSIDYSRMGTEYRRHLINFKETIYPIYHYSRIPRMLKDIARNVKKDNRRLDKKDFLAIRKLINQQLDELEALCCTDYDYEAEIQAIRDKCDNSLQEMKEELNQLEKNVEKIKDSSIFS